MVREDIEALINIAEAASEEITNGTNGWGDTNYITVINAKDFINGLKDLMYKEKEE